MMRTPALSTAIAFLLLSTPLLAQPAAPPPPPAAAPEPPIPAQVLDSMLRRELGPLATPQVAPKLGPAHELIEKYFAARPAERKPIVKDLEATGLDPSIIGRLSRIRSNWPAFDGGGIFYVNERVGPHAVMYFIGAPKAYDRTKPWPLLIKLPGAQAFVNEPKPTGDDVARIYKDWVKEELDKHPDALVLMPLLNFDELWGPSQAGMNGVMQPIFHAYSRFNIDPAKVYMLGQGMSAHGTWNLALHYPTYFAAINPIAGGTGGAWQKLRIVNLRDIYCVLWHDASDTNVKVGLSREMANILKKYKFDYDYEESENVGHAPTEEIAQRLYTKLRSRTRDLYPKEVMLASNRPEAIFNRNDWVQVYQMLNPGGEQRVRFQLGSGMVSMYQNSYSISAAITAPNKIEIKSENVESFRLFLNDQMIDVARPVTVIVNKKVRHEGPVKVSLEEMLKDQTFLNRGWRYYPAYLDIDFGTIPVGGSGSTTKPATQPSPATPPRTTVPQPRSGARP
jgi:hypothetical protein